MITCKHCNSILSKEEEYFEHTSFNLATNEEVRLCNKCYITLHLTKITDLPAMVDSVYYHKKTKETRVVAITFNGEGTTYYITSLSMKDVELIKETYNSLYDHGLYQGDFETYIGTLDLDNELFYLTIIEEY